MENGVPMELQSCHTAVVDGYIVEGHVPVEQINDMLAEKPDIAGLAVAGMPAGSPGMGNAAGRVDPYQVISFNLSGIVEVVASYP